MNDNENKILVVVDMQNDFIDGSLGTPEALSIVDNVKNKILEYKHDMVYATQDTHLMDYLTTQEGLMLPIEHCMFGTHGWKISDKISKLIGANRIYQKRTFASYELADDLAYVCFSINWQSKSSANRASIINDYYPEIEIVGLCTDICVVSNALLLKSKIPYAKITVDASCCAGTNPERHKEALDVMRSCQIYITNDGEYSG